MGSLYFLRGVFLFLRSISEDDEIKAPISEKSDKMRGVFGLIFLEEMECSCRSLAFRFIVFVNGNCVPLNKGCN